MTDTAELDVQRDRAAKNQSLFREVNERIEDLSRSGQLATFVCECCNDECDESLSLSLDEYEHVRARSNSFFVLPGHEVSEVEEIIESRERYEVVAKLGVGSSVAERLDPRKRVRR